MEKQRTIMLQRAMIKFYGYDWSLEPMFEMRGTDSFIVGWYLKFIAYANQATNYVNAEITTSRIVEVDLDNFDRDGICIFKTRSGRYYQMYKINEKFATSKWSNGSDLELRKRIESSELISYATAANIANIHTNRNNFIDYVVQVTYNIIEKTETDVDADDEQIY